MLEKQDSHSVLSPIDAIQYAIEIISSKYRGPWIVPDLKNESAILHWSRQSAERYESIIDAHSHTFMELCVCLEGRCALQIGSNYYLLEEGEISILDSEVLHNELPEKLQPYKAIWLGIDSFRAVVQTVHRDYNKQFVSYEGDQFEYGFDYQFALQNVKLERKNRENGHSGLLKAYVMQILLLTLRMLENSQSCQNRGDWKDTIVKKTLQYIELNHTRHIRLSEISQHLCISINHLNNIFKSEMGLTIPQYMDDYKIQKASYLLRETAEPIQSIASQLGYYDQYHFSKIFKKETGSTPTNFRKTAT